jgi:hypothetical protein
MKTFITSIAAVLLLCFSAAAAESTLPKWEKEPTTYRGVTFGASFETVQKTLKDAGQPVALFPKAGEKYPVLSSALKFDDVILINYFYFDADGKLTHVGMTFNPKDYDFVKSVFIEKYGEPTITLPSQVRNLTGAVLPNEEIAWIGQNLSAHFQKYFDNIDTSTGQIGLRSYYQDDSGEKAKKAEAASKF